MGIFGSFKKKKPEEKPEEIRVQTPPLRGELAPGKWQIGDKILDRYEIHDIKWGGMGIVYIVLDHQWDHIFAMKTFQDKYLWNKDVIDRFMTEAEIWVNLERHSNIVFANFVQKIEGKPYIFLEYIDGGDLSRYIGKLDIPHALDFAIQFCVGMDYAYNQLGVIHRDIKPSNVMITSEGVAKVTDFGLVKAVKEKRFEEELELGKVVVSRIMGTWPYMSPEQFPEEMQRHFSYKPREVTTRSDIYSFGVTFYEVLTGRLPFSSMEQIFTKSPSNSRSLNPFVPALLDILLLKCLEKDPNQRKYKSFNEVMKELIEIYNSLPEEQKVFGVRYFVKGKKELLTAIDWNNKGVALADLGKPQEAITCCDRALEINPSYAEAWVNKGIALADLGRQQESIACYDKALKINPRDTLTWNNKGNALVDLGRTHEAIACYDKALEINPRDTIAWNNKGNALAELGRPQEAITCYDKTLEINSRDAVAWNNKGMALGKLGRPQEAITCYDKTLEINPRGLEAWCNKGNDLIDLGKPQEAIYCCDRALEINPGFAVAWYNKGFALVGLGKLQEAIACFKKFIEIAPPQYESNIKKIKEFINLFE